MNRCSRMIDAGRRKFLTGAGVAAAGVAAAQISPPQAKAAPAAARVDYPSNRLANLQDLKVDEPLNVAYPDQDAPGVLIKLGKRVPTAAPAPTATSSASPPSARTRASRSPTTRATGR